MKLKLSIGIVFILLCNFYKAQCPENNIHTDWNPSYVSPGTNNFHKNTFDWTVPNFTFAKVVSPFIGGTLKSPFWSSNALYPISSSALSNFHPDEGWELIKQDLGYFYDAITSSWNGSGNVNGTIMGTGLLGDPRQQGSALNYIVLYNKYSGTLRVMAFIDNSIYNNIYVKLRFLEASVDYTNPQGNNSYQPSVNALFNHYNVKSALALDQKTIVKEIAALSTFPNGNGSGINGTHDMLYADFQLAYDPCTCLFKSAFEVRFEAIQTSNVVLNGKYAGVSSPFDNVATNISNYGVGSVYGTSPNDQFITSVFESNNSPATALQSYYNQTALYNSNINGSNANVNLTNAINTFATAIPLASAAFGNANIPGTEIAVKKALEAGAKILDFASTKLEPTPVQKPTPITINAGYLTATGTITTVNQFPTINFRLGVPGSLPPDNMTSLPEYAPAANGGQPYPNSPVYNDVPGAFALLNTPLVQEFTASNWTQPNSVHNNSGIVRAYHPARDLLYALNPLYDAAQSKIYVGYEMTGATTFTFPLNAGGTEELFKNWTIQGWDPSESYIDHLQGDNSVNGQVPIFKHMLRSAFLPIGCNQSMYFKESYTFDSNVDPLFSVVYPVDHSPPFDGGFPHDIYLVVLLDLVSKPDIYNKTHRTSQIIKYKCARTRTFTDFTLSGNVPAAMTALSGYNAMNANDIDVPVTVYGAGQTVSATHIVNIVDNQTNTQLNVVDFIAGSQISIFNNEVALTGELALYINNVDYFANCSEQSLQPIVGEDLTDYCTKSGSYLANGYGANVAARTMPSHITQEADPKITSVQAIEKSQHTLGIYPNPTRGTIFLNCQSTEKAVINLVIEDLLGKTVLYQNIEMEIGYNQNQVSLQALDNGIYLIRLVGQDGVIYKTEKIILAK